MSVMAPASKTPTTTYQYGMNTAQPRQGDFGGWLTGPSRPAFPQGENTYKQTTPAGGNYGEWLTGPTPTAAGGKPMDMSMYSPGKAQPTQAPAIGTPYYDPAAKTTQTGMMTQPRTYQDLQAMHPEWGAMVSAGTAQPYSAYQSQGSPYQTAPQAPNAPQPYQPMRGVQSGGLMADPEETRRYDEIMARNGVSRQDYADPRYQDYLSTLHQRMGDPVSNIEEFGRYKQTGQTPYQLPPPPANSAQPRPYGNDQYTPPRREPAILIDGRPQRGPAPDQQQNPFAGMQPGVYSPTGQFYGGDPVQGLSQAQRQRDAFVMQMNQATLPYQMANVFGQDLGAPNYDFQGMLGRANKMVEDGFYNPFTQYFNQDLADQMSRYAPPSMYQTGRGPRGGIYT